MRYCRYYQAYIKPETCWFVTGVLRSFEHIAFDRTIDVEASIFEFFVPPLMQSYFLSVMEYLQKEGFAANLKELPNRLCDAETE